MRSRCGPSKAGGRARELPPRWQLRELGSGAAGAAVAVERPARRSLKHGPRGGNRVGSWKLSWQVNSICPGAAAGLRASAAGSVAGDGGEEGSRGAARETRERLVGKFRDASLLRPAQRELSGNRRGHAWRSRPRARRCRGIGAGRFLRTGRNGLQQSRAGDTGITRRAGLSQPPLVLLFRPSARQALGCAGHLE
ncbi:hypothetical protein NN561_009086 [Cricetulus griseus]